MRKRNIIKLTLIREQADTLLKLWIAPELEAVFAPPNGGKSNMEVSTQWHDSEGKGLMFYKKDIEFAEKIKSDSIANDFGKSLLVAGDYGTKVNIALLRVVGASQRGGVLIKCNDLIGYEELKQYMELLGSWSKNFYRDYIKKTKLTATISLEM